MTNVEIPMTEAELHVNERLERARDMQSEIRRILLSEWDPIGVSDVPEAQDEYDGYIAQIYGILIRREPKQKLVEFLWWAETQNMGLFGSRKRADHVADLLQQLV
jgi:hypothetical protein